MYILRKMVSESKSDWVRAAGLEDDSECGICGLTLFKQTTYYTPYRAPSGVMLILCPQCGSLSEEERTELMQMAEEAAKNKVSGDELFKMHHANMLAMSDMNTNVNGAVDFESWMAAAQETFGKGSSDTTGISFGACAAGGVADESTTKSVSILPDDVISAEIRRMKEASDAEMAAAKAEWGEKSKYFMTPSDSDFIPANASETDFLPFSNIQGPDAFSYSYMGRQAAGDAAAGGAGATQTNEVQWLGKAAVDGKTEKAANTEMTEQQLFMLGLDD